MRNEAGRNELILKVLVRQINYTVVERKREFLFVVKEVANIIAAGLKCKTR